jgi:HD-GYP domain-containing protein (c-di-GMP phosphodiesterase class II)
LYAAHLLSNVPGFEWLPPIVAQVYERENGGGYPRGLKGKEVLEEAKVLGLVDVFEACIHHRPQRRAMTGYQSLEILTAEVKTFLQRITKAMLRSLTVYPLNEYVELNTREIGKVIRINKENPLRPIVSVIFSSNGEPVDQPRVLNLAENSSLWVARAITLDELPQVVA